MPVNVGDAIGAKLLVTYAVVAICVLLSPAIGVVAVTMPVNVGDAIGAKLFVTYAVVAKGAILAFTYVVVAKRALLAAVDVDVDVARDAIL